MGKQLLLGTVLGAIVLFIWSALSWMVIPWPGEPLRSFTNAEELAQAIKANTPRSGNYLLPNEVKRTPGMTEEQYQKAMQDANNRMMQGPIVFAAVRLEPFGSMSRPLILKFLTDLVIAFLATLLLLKTTGLPYPGRVVFLTIIGVIIFVGANIDEWNWFSFSTAYTLMQAGVTIIGWFLAALVMSLVVKTRPVAA
jgi:hypothetical protein